MRSGTITGQARGIIRQRLAFRRGQKLADSKHHVAGVIAPLGLAPQVELFGKVSGRLAGQRRVGRAKPLPLLAVTGCTGRQPTRGIAFMVKSQAPGDLGGARERQPGVIDGHRLALAGVELLRDPAHLHVGAATVAISVQLAFQIACIEPRQTRRARAVPSPLEPMAGKAGVIRPCRRAAERNQPPVFRKAVERNGLGRGTAGKQRRKSQEDKFAHGSATAHSLRLFQALRMAPLLLLTVACKPPPEQRHFMPLADAAHGKSVIERVGCGSCHTISGIAWPQGKVGPNLEGLARRALIAGKLPNRPDVLASYIRNAPALVPGSGMPAMPVSESESRDIAAYLYEQGDR